MKNLLFVLTLVLATFSLSANANPINFSSDSHGNPAVYFESSAVLLKIVDSKISTFLTKASYDEENQYFTIEVIEDIQFIQILNHLGELEYQLPVQNSTVHISLKQFNEGLYSVNLMFDGESDYLRTELIIK